MSIADNVHARDARAFDALEWIVTFINEHDDWACQQFQPDTAEYEWLQWAREILATKTS